MTAQTAITLDDKYAAPEGRIFVTGMQALVRLLIEQRRRDAAAGLNTGGFVSGYRGSPISGLDRELWKAGRHLDAAGVKFQPGVNEEIAATSLWGSQQVGMFRGPKVDGVFGMWYGKGPGLDRSGDAIRHANQAGTSPLGGVLAVVGDDHSAKSSAFGAQSEYAFLDWQMPVLAPANVGEFIDFGLFGYALSRFSGSWVGFKVAGVSADSSATVTLPGDALTFVTPEVAQPPGGLHIRSPEPDRAAYEARVKDYRLPAVRAFAAANGVNRRLVDAARPRVGIVTAGKGAGDLLQALADLGIDAGMAEALGLRVLKLGMTYPLVPDEIAEFARGLETVVVAEEKRPFVEDQIKAILYDARLPDPPRLLGKRDAGGAPLFSDSRDFDPLTLARALVPLIATPGTRDRLDQALGRMEANAVPVGDVPLLVRTPYFCSGCPHNRSTVLPEGSQAIGGIGCHTLATRMNRDIRTITHMGGEGASWIGISPFVEQAHMFQNVGDGTYFHSAQLCIRASVAAKVSMTYKILYNDAIAMTGGQPLDGTLMVDQLARQVSAEGVGRIALVTDEPDKYGRAFDFPKGLTIHHRDDLDAVQKDLRDVEGVSVLIYDQTCAAEKRRRRKKGAFPDPKLRAFINQEVCEGCGDCQKKSNCLSVTPVETALGPKRQIDQTSCNKDYSCLDGFCPSFVRIEGGDLRKGRMTPPPGDEPAEPDTALGEDPRSILLAGIGGTGIVTVGAILGMAAHLEGLACTVNDVTGSAQKGGLVASHVVLAKTRDRLKGERIGKGRADALIAADLVVGATPEILDRIGPATRFALVNTDPAQTGDFLADPSKRFPGDEMLGRVAERLAAGRAADGFAATTAALALTGNAVGANMLMLGYAWQRGAVPLPLSAIHEAIRLNGVAVEANVGAFAWGRRLAEDAALVAEVTGSADRAPETLEDIVADRTARLTAYQSARYAARYRALVDEVRTAETRATGGERLSLAVARNAYKLMAYKDEYEVARLLTAPEFEARIKARFDGGYRVAYMLAPPIMARTDPATGEPKKRRFGPWLRGPLKLMARGRALRGTALDPFGRTAERRAERALAEDYAADIRALLPGLSARTLDAAVALAELPDMVRGYGPIKERAMAAHAEARRQALEGLETPQGARKTEPVPA